MAAVQMMASFRYRWPPGTGMPKELMAMFRAISMAVTVSHLMGRTVRREDAADMGKAFFLNVVFTCFLHDFFIVSSLWPCEKSQYAKKL